MTRLDSLMRELKAEHRGQRAPDAVGENLAREFRRRQRRRWTWPVLAATAAAAGVAAFFLAQPPPVETLALRVAAPRAPEVRVTPRPVMAAMVRPKRPRPAAPAVRQGAEQAAEQTAAAAREIATDFFPLRPEPLIESGEWLRIVRTHIPRGELRRFGLAATPVPASPQLSSDVAADVVLGNDGTARAIRFVHYTQ